MRMCSGCSKRLVGWISAALARWAELIYEAWKRGRYVFILGNGGSGTTASHMCEDLGKSTLPESLLIR